MGDRGAQDGTIWDETTPTDASYAYQIDDYNRDVRKGIRSRMALEHEFPASQSTTGEGGRHKYITLQNQTAAPTLYATQYGAVYVQTTGNQLCYVNSTGSTILVTGTAIGTSGSIIRGQRQGSIINLTTNYGLQTATADGFIGVVALCDKNTAAGIGIYIGSGTSTADILISYASQSQYDVSTEATRFKSAFALIQKGKAWRVVVGGAATVYSAYLVTMGE